MRVLICDVCDEKYEDGDPMISMEVPAYFLNHEGNDVLKVDVCTWECVSRMVEAISQEDNEPPSSPEEEEEAPPDRFLDVPPTPVVDNTMDPRALAKYTEQVTGVKRR